MHNGMAISINYWAAQKGSLDLDDLTGINDFRDELEAEYVTIVRGRPGALGGLYHLTAEVVSTLTLSHVLQLLLDGVAFDLIKSGTKAFVLRPLLTAYNKLRERNKSHDGDIDELRLIFQDSLVTIYCVAPDSIASSLEQILRTLASNYEHLLLRSGERPFEVHIPVFEDPSKERPSRFRVLLDVDETIPSFGVSDYFRLWGLWYDFSGKHRVYDVSRQLLIDEEFLSRQRYWAIWEERWRSSPPASKTNLSGTPMP